MSKYIEGVSARQGCLFPTYLDDLIEPENPVRFIEAFVDDMDLRSLKFTRPVSSDTGRPPYSVRTLLKLYIYGHLNRIRSSRRLEKECGRNVELWWLLDRLCPDHNTLAIFRAANLKALKKVFSLFVRLCAELGLCGKERICVDGTTLKAVNGMDTATSMELSQKKLDYVKRQLALVEKYLSGLDENDKLEQGSLNQPFALDIDPQNLPDPAELKKRIAFHEDCIREMEEKHETQLTFTDPDARMMPSKRGGLKVCYNVQTATDPQSHMITGFLVTNHANDMNLMHDTVEIARENLGAQAVCVTADKGYESAKDIERCVLDGMMPDVGFRYDREERVLNLDYVPQEITPEMRASQRSEDIRACLHAGVLPDCYQGTNLRIELQWQSVESCFIRHEDGTVTCPMGKLLVFQGHKKNGTTYGSKEACRTCPNRCTDGKTFKTVKFGPETTYVPVRMYGSPRYPLKQIPDVEQPDRYHAYGRVQHAPARVMVFIHRDKEKQRERMQTSEHPFGTIKHYDGAGYFLCKGKEKVTAESALIYLSYDIRRAIKLAGGVQRLIALFRSRMRSGIPMPI